MKDGHPIGNGGKQGGNRLISSFVVLPRPSFVFLRKVRVTRYADDQAEIGPEKKRGENF